jgi:hypothetical protein
MIGFFLWVIAWFAVRSVRWGKCGRLFIHSCCDFLVFYLYSLFSVIMWTFLNKWSQRSTCLGFFWNFKTFFVHLLLPFKWFCLVLIRCIFDTVVHLLSASPSIFFLGRSLWYFLLFGWNCRFNVYGLSFLLFG